MRKPDDGEHLEAHIMDETGHVTDTDCWCEPTYYWITDREGSPVLVVEHNDTDERQHVVVLHDREVNRDWITVLFDSLKGSDR